MHFCCCCKYYFESLEACLWTQSKLSNTSSSMRDTAKLGEPYAAWGADCGDCRDMGFFTAVWLTRHKIYWDLFLYLPLCLPSLKFVSVFMALDTDLYLDGVELLKFFNTLKLDRSRSGESIYQGVLPCHKALGDSLNLDWEMDFLSSCTKGKWHSSCVSPFTSKISVLLLPTSQPSGEASNNLQSIYIQFAPFHKIHRKLHFSSVAEKNSVKRYSSIVSILHVTKLKIEKIYA